MSSDELPEGWTRHVAPTGHYYYYNAETGVSTYDKREVAPPPAAAAAAPPAAEENPRNPKNPKKRRRPKQTTSRPDRPKFKIDLEENAPWVLVVCKSGKRFVHNKETGESVWNGPDAVMQEVQQLDRDELLVLIAKARGLKLDDEKKKSAQEKEEPAPGPQPQPQPQPQSQPEHGPEPAESEPESESSSEDEAGIQGEDNNEDEEEEEEVEFESDSEDDMDEATKLEQFRAMLDQGGANCYGSWDDTERDKFINDDRYDVIDSNKRRREVFDAWATERIQSQPKRPDSSTGANPVPEFLAFVAANYNKKKHQFYLDFKRKLRKEPGFAQADLSDPDKEKCFREYASLWKKSEGDRARLKQDAIDANDTCNAAFYL